MTGVGSSTDGTALAEGGARPEERTTAGGESLTGRHVVISGGGSGIGAAVARDMVAAGAAVTVLGRNRAKLESLGLDHVVCDVTDPGAVSAALDSARRMHGPIQVAVANAGAVISAPFVTADPGDVRAMLDVNLLGVIHLWQYAVSDMLDADWGRLIAVASTAGLKGYAYVSGYCASKHAVVGLTRSVALELADTGVTVNAVCPGYVDTPMLAESIDTVAARTGMDRDRVAARLQAVNPQGRFVSAGEVAGAVHWLCSNSARSVNGHALALSGGEI